jgi:peptidoglycan-N-acetylglucosamine deacetylase
MTSLQKELVFIGIGCSNYIDRSFMKVFALLFMLISTSLFSQSLDLPPDVAKAMLIARASPIKPSVTSFVLRHGNRDLKEIALTIDDGYKPDMRIIDLLHSYNITPTVFIVGAVVYLNPDFIKQMNALGWEIGNHTYYHPWTTKIDNEELNNQIHRTYDEIKEVTGKEPIKLFRPPYGAYNARTLEDITLQGYKIILWDNEIMDWFQGINPSLQIDHAMGLLQNGNILLCHFGGYNTYEVLKVLIPDILAKGYKFVTISQMIADLNGKAGEAQIEPTKLPPQEGTNDQTYFEGK